MFEKIKSIQLKPYQKELLIFLGFITISFLVFFPSFLNQNFFWDDERFVFLNPSVLQAPNWYSFWIVKSDFHKSWPLGYSIFWILVKIFPAAGFSFYKSINIFFHGLNGFLIFKLMNKFNFKWPLLLSFIFLLHPLNVENVSWIFQLLTLISFTSFLISFICVLNYTYTNKIFYIILSLIFFLFSLWIKSIAIFYPILLVIIFWIYKVNWNKYLLILPFFFLSFYIGLNNLAGNERFVQKPKPDTASKISQHVLTQINDSIQHILPSALNQPKVKNTDDKEYFDYIFRKEKNPDKYEFNSASVFAQAPWHYFSQLIAPIHLQFIYPVRNFNYFLNIFSYFCLFFFPLLLYLKLKQREYLLLTGFSLVFLVPYIGITNITFFYWSNVSDRYTYGFVLVLVFGIGFLINQFNSKLLIQRIILIYLSLLLGQTIYYGVKFNTPERLYEEIILYKPHPVFYSSLLEVYLAKLDLKNSERVYHEQVRLFPQDPSIEMNGLRLKSLEEFFKANH